MGKKIKFIKGLCHGVFDIIHIGHLKHFNEAKKYCNYLIVSITSDRFVRKSKGPKKPIFNQDERFKILSSLKIVDEVIISDCETAEDSIKKIKPKFYFKGKDYKKSLDKNLNFERKLIASLGGKVIFTNTPLNSSSEIINKKFFDIENFYEKKISNNKKDIFKNKISRFCAQNIKNKILVIGEHILDTYVSTNVQGKSGKNNILTSSFQSSKSFGGGVMLVSNLLSSFMSKVDTICWKNQNNDKIYKKFLNKNVNKINFNTNAKIIVKKRFQDSYLGTKLFQLNTNQEDILDNNFKKKFEIFFNKLNLAKYDAIIIFDYGHGLINRNIVNKLGRFKKKVYVNCQSNSFNFGYNLFSKYKSANTVSMDETEFRLLVQDKFTKIKDLLKKNKSLFKNFQNVIITLGKFGAYHVTKKRIEFVKSIISSTKDTTGCGDIFFSIYILLDLFSDLDLQQKIIISHLCAGIHAEYEGNDNQVTRNNLTKFAKSYLF
jgi:rfaE bifunctional protein nucleotidyltransferase chain/domain